MRTFSALFWFILSFINIVLTMSYYQSESYWWMLVGMIGSIYCVTYLIRAMNERGTE